MADEYWIDGPTDVGGIVEYVRGLEAETPDELSRLAVESGFVSTEDDYYELLHDVAIELARLRLGELSSSDADLVHAVRSLDTLDEVSNEVDERVRDWDGDVDDGRPEPLESLGNRVQELEETRDELSEFVETRAPEVAPNLSNLAGPLLAARLVALAGSLEKLARMPSSTVQVLGAEDALFRHLRDGSPPPKHGVIYLHPYVRNTSEDERGSAARALAGKLTIAARIDYYSGDLREELADELDEKIDRIRSR